MIEKQFDVAHFAEARRVDRILLFELVLKSAYQHSYTRVEVDAPGSE